MDCQKMGREFIMQPDRFAFVPASVTPYYEPCISRRRLLMLEQHPASLQVWRVTRDSMRSRVTIPTMRWPGRRHYQVPTIQSACHIDTEDASFDVVTIFHTSNLPTQWRY